jgi:hypothetical protein
VNVVQREQLLNAISAATLTRFRSGVAMNDQAMSVDEVMELYTHAHELVEDCYRMVRDIWAGDQSPDDL